MVRSWLLFAASASSARSSPRDVPSRAPSSTTRAAAAATAATIWRRASRRPISTVAPRCGDGVCTDGSGEACDTCPADCGSCGCPMGYADCNNNMADGCETPLNTPTNCGGCGHVCQQVGGTNACVLSGTNYVCQPTCDATHADCNHMPDDGCEVDLSGPNNCGGCGNACANPHGTTTCTTQGNGFFCNPTCTRAVGRVRRRQVGRLHDQHRQRRSGELRRVRPRLLDGGHDRDRVQQRRLHADVRGAVQRLLRSGGARRRQRLRDQRHRRHRRERQRLRRPVGDDERRQHDDDQRQPHLAGGRRRHVPRALHRGLAHLLPRHVAGVHRARAGDAAGGHEPLLSVDNTNESCDNTWKNYNSTGICVTWCGSCGSTDDTDWYFQVSGVNGANSCVELHASRSRTRAEGNAPAGCTKPSC